LEKACLDGVYYRLDTPGVVVSRQSHEDVYFADVDQLANKIVCEYAFLDQPASNIVVLGAAGMNITAHEPSEDIQIRRSRNQ